MSFVLNLPLFCILLSVTSAVLCLLFPRRRSSFWITVTNFSLAAALSLILLIYVAKTGEAYVYRMGRFSAPFGNELRFGSFEALMAAGFSVVNLFSIVGGVRDTVLDIAWKKIGTYYLMLNLMMCAMLAIIYTNDLFTAYIFIDLITISACTIIAARRTGTALVSTTTFLIMSLIGSAMILLAVAILYGITGHLLMPQLGESVRALMATGKYNVPLFVVTALFVIGFGVKGALFPFHMWLPDAHASSTTTTSAVLSGLLIKVYPVLLIKLFFRVFGIEALDALRITDLLFVLGLAGIFWGAFKASRQINIKRMLAYSSVSQVSFISAGIGLGLFNSFAAVSYQILAHSLAKSMLVCAVGALSAHSGGKKDFHSLRGSARKSPLMGAAFAVGTFSMIGIPPLPGFFAKLYLGTATIESTVWLPTIVMVVVIASLLSASYYIPSLICLFAKPADGDITVRRRDNPSSVIAISAFLIMCIVLGLFSAQVMRVIEQGLSVLG